MIWDQKKIATLKAMRARGDSYAVIGAALGCSRSAACGQGYRAGLSQAKPPRKSNADGVKNASPRPPASSIMEIAPRAGDPVPLGDLHGGCCWIHPAPPKRLFCGHATVDGTWCELHRARVYRAAVGRAAAA